MPARVGWSILGGEGPVLDNQAVLKPENVEEDVSSGSLPLSLGHDVGAILECPYHGRLHLLTRRLIDELCEPFHTVGRVRVVLHKSLVVDVLRRNVYIPGADAVKYRQNFLDVSFRHCLISFDRVGRPSLSRARKAFNPFLVIAVERTGILPPEFLEEEGALLRFLAQQVTACVRWSDDPAVIGARTGLVAVDQCRPREPAAGHALRHDKMHRKANRHPAVSGSERKFRLTGQDLDLIFGRKVARPILS